MKNKRNPSVFSRRTGCLIILMILSVLLLAACGAGIPNSVVPTDEPIVDATAAPTEAPTAAPTEAPTEPLPPYPPDGNPNDITCKGSYTAGKMELSKNAQQVVARVGDHELTSGLLQIYYQTAINEYRLKGLEYGPNFEDRLDTQLRDLDGISITWQQFFLQEALNNWHSHAAMMESSKTEELPLEEAYDRNEKKHEENLKTQIYNLNRLYGYNTKYTVSGAHQAYLDNLPTMLENMAAERGYKSTAAMANDLAGVGSNDKFLLEYARLLNEGYMYMTALSYHIEPLSADVEEYFTANEDSYAAAGISKDGYLVNLRHILVIPDDATVAEDGTVTASDADWSDCKTEANKLLNKWRNNKTEDYFGELAYRYSDDTGSNINGGLYSNLAKGQLTADLDAWCFDEDRKVGDTAIIRTGAGYHVVYFCEPTEIWFEQAEDDLIAEMLANEIKSAAKKHPMTVDYSAIMLDDPRREDLRLTDRDFLYPDIAHERFDKAPLYFQQDYPNTMYGNYSLVTYGCGVTTMSMLTSYMTDDEWTPPEMCALYGKYCSDKGTAHSMFLEVPVDRGFYAEERVQSWEEALAALKEGYIVVTLQREGYWTRGGHYLLLHNLIETEDGTKVQVWDSNLYNYKRLEGHTIGYFDLDTIPKNARTYWIYQKKVTRFDTCVRCGEPTAESHVPSAMFATDYICQKCDVAINRWEAYLSACADLGPLLYSEMIPEETEPVETEPVETEPTEPTEEATLPEDPDHDFDVIVPESGD